MTVVGVQLSDGTWYEGRYTWLMTVVWVQLTHKLMTVVWFQVPDSMGMKDSTQAYDSCLGSAPR